MGKSECFKFSNTLINFLITATKHKRTDLRQEGFLAHSSGGTVHPGRDQRGKAFYTAGDRHVLEKLHMIMKGTICNVAWKYNASSHKDNGKPSSLG